MKSSPSACANSAGTNVLPAALMGATSCKSKLPRRWMAMRRRAIAAETSSFGRRIREMYLACVEAGVNTGIACVEAGVRYVLRCKLVHYVFK